MLRKLKWQLPGEPLAARYNWCQGPVPGHGPAVEKHCPRRLVLTHYESFKSYVRSTIPFLSHWYTHLLLSDVSLSERGCEGLYGGHEILSYSIYKMPYACCQELGLANLSEYRIQLIKHTQSLTKVLTSLIPPYKGCPKCFAIKHSYL